MDQEASGSTRRPVSLRRWAYMLAGLVVGGSFLYLAARDVDFHEAMAAIYAINAAWVVPFTLIWLLNVLLRSIRWQYLFPDESRPSLRHAVDGFVLSKVGNNFMPGRLGEVLRAAVIGRFYPGVGMSGSLATIVIEKILDSLAILAMLGIALFFAPLPEWITRTGMWLIVVFSLLLLVLWLVSRASDHRVFEPDASVPGGALGRLTGMALRLVRKFATGLHALRAGHHFTWSTLLTIVIWAGESAMLFTLIKAFSIPAPFMAGVVGMVFLCIGAMLPTAPGSVGTYQLFIVAALQIYGVPETEAFALSIFMNVYVVVLVSVTGVLVFMTEGGMVNLRQLMSASVKSA